MLIYVTLQCKDNALHWKTSLATQDFICSIFPDVHGITICLFMCSKIACKTLHMWAMHVLFNLWLICTILLILHAVILQKIWDIYIDILLVLAKVSRKYDNSSSALSMVWLTSKLIHTCIQFTHVPFTHVFFNFIWGISQSSHAERES